MTYCSLEENKWMVHFLSQETSYLRKIVNENSVGVKSLLRKLICATPYNKYEETAQLR